MLSSLLRRLPLLFRVSLVLGFALVLARHWHPYYGFTSFLQIDGRMAAQAIPAAKTDRIFHHLEPGAYDGGYYAQIATDPALRDPALRTATDDLGYRARRILVPALAWVLGGGDAIGALRTYPWINVVLWFGLAALLWRVFPLGDWRGQVAWAGMLLGAGVILSVRLALTDLAALTLIAGAALLAERGRTLVAAGLLGLAGLARETAVLGAAILLPANGRDLRQDPARRLLRLALVALPLAIWLAYIHVTVGGSSAGKDNLSWPFSGWWQRWAIVVHELGAPSRTPLQWESLLEHIALTAQAAYLLFRPRRDCAWWRLGFAYVVLLAVLGEAVWDGFPNATSRVLLPLTLAFQVRVVRDRARWFWFVLGNLSLLAGFHALQYPAGIAHELPAHSTWSSRQVLETDARWSVTEWNSKWRWAWCADAGGLSFRTWPQRPSLQLELQLRGLTPRRVEVWHAGHLVWEGQVGDRPQWISLPVLPARDGRLELELRSALPATAEGADNTARRIGLACFGARLAEP